jgi:hypothetical protein
VARQNNIGSLTLVDLRGRFKPEVTDFAGEYVKAEYLSAEEQAGRRSRAATSTSAWTSASPSS